LQSKVNVSGAWFRCLPREHSYGFVKCSVGVGFVQQVRLVSDLVCWAIGNCEISFYAVKPLSEKVRSEKSTLRLMRPFGNSEDRFSISFNASVKFCDRSAVF
jgi:hypothetical protein